MGVACGVAQEAHARCTASPRIQNARPVRGAPEGCRGKTSPGGAGKSRREERASDSPEARQDQLPARASEATDEKENKSAHGIVGWLRKTQAHQAPGSPNTRRRRNRARLFQQGETSRGGGFRPHRAPLERRPLPGLYRSGSRSSSSALRSESSGRWRAATSVCSAYCSTTWPSLMRCTRMRAGGLALPLGKRKNSPSL